MAEVTDGFINGQQFFVEGAVLLLKKAMGVRTPSMSCCNTAPTASDDASVVRVVGELGAG